MNNSEEFLLKVKSFLENLGYNTKVYILVWTTTPWTLPANLALAINKDIEYCAYICNESFEENGGIFIASKIYFDKQTKNHWFLGGFKFPMQDTFVDGRKVGERMEQGFINQLKLGILKSYFPSEEEFNKKYVQYLSDSAEHYLKTKDDPKKFTGQYEPIFPYFKGLGEVKNPELLTNKKE